MLLPPDSGWQTQIWALLQQHGHVDADGDGPIVFVNSYYIDHDRHPHEDRSRPLRFDTDHADWDRQIRFMWEDLVDKEMPIDIVLVNPAPPLLVRQGTVATVIVHQHLSPFKSACLTTALIPADPDLRLLESAHSVAHESNFHDLLQLAGVANHCA